MSFAGLHLVTDTRQPLDRMLRVVDAATASGAAVIQVRVKDGSARAFTETVIAVAGAVGGRAAVVVNDRVDVALAARHAGARVDGVHLGQDDLDPVVARELLGADALIGWTAHHDTHLAAVRELPAGTVDYLGVGLIHPTISKDDGPPCLGVDGFRAFAAAAPLPCVAIGGVRTEDVPGLMAAGAAGVAVVSAVAGAPDPAAAATGFVTAIGAGR